MYREVQQIRDDIQTVQKAVRAGLLADTTRDISSYTSEAMALIDGLIQRLGGMSVDGAEDVEPALVRAAGRALNQAWVQSERVGVGSTVPAMREALVDCKTFIDYAEAYTAASLGVEFAQ